MKRKSKKIVQEERYYTGNNILFSSPADKEESPFKNDKGVFWND